jgi:hypothetical protein
MGQARQITVATSDRIALLNRWGDDLPLSFAGDADFHGRIAVRDVNFLDPMPLISLRVFFSVGLGK